MMLLLLVAAVGIAGQASASILDAGTTPNRFMVTYAPAPSFETMSYFSMPRNWQEANKLGFYNCENWLREKVELWCRMSDYRVCVLFDSMGSAAGIHLSVSVTDMASSSLNVTNTPEWHRRQLLGVEVYSAVVYFVDKDVISKGGRKDLWQSSGLTIPNVIYIKQTDAEGNETGRLHVPPSEVGAEAVGFKEQNCFVGMGKHYFQELTPTSSCETQRPYFTLYNKKTKQLQGFGFNVYGRSSLQRRKWFETPPALAAKMIAPNSPSCMNDWINKYGMFTLHVFFVDRPWLSRCW